MVRGWFGLTERNGEGGGVMKWFETLLRWLDYSPPLPKKCLCGKDPVLHYSTEIGRRSMQYRCEDRVGCGEVGPYRLSRAEACVAWDVWIDRQRERTRRR